MDELALSEDIHAFYDALVEALYMVPKKGPTVVCSDHNWAMYRAVPISDAPINMLEQEGDILEADAYKATYAPKAIVLPKGRVRVVLEFASPPSLEEVKQFMRIGRKY